MFKPFVWRGAAGAMLVLIATAGIPVVLGREFSSTDAAGARKVVVVNEAWVRRYAEGRNPIGLHVGDDGAESIQKYEVVGVVRDSLTAATAQPVRLTLGYTISRTRSSMILRTILSGT